MLVYIHSVFSPGEVQEIRRLLNDASWGDGRETAGYLSARLVAEALDTQHGAGEGTRIN
jgi:predicted 2-oxoglutarate/Fe(II)-dependent dioxygenase YbiX